MKDLTVRRIKVIIDEFDAIRGEGVYDVVVVDVSQSPVFINIGIRQSADDDYDGRQRDKDYRDSLTLKIEPMADPIFADPIFPFIDGDPEEGKDWYYDHDRYDVVS